MEPEPKPRREKKVERVMEEKVMKRIKSKLGGEGVFTQKNKTGLPLQLILYYRTVTQMLQQV